MSVRTKILALLSGVLLLSTAGAGFALLTLERAGDALRVVAGRDVPLLRVTTDLTASRLEQSIRFERVLRLSAREPAPGETPAWRHAETEFEGLAADIWRSLQQGRDLAERAGAKPVRQELAQIDAAHNRYAEDVRGVFALLAAGRRPEALAAAGRIADDEDRLQQAIGRLLVAVSARVEDAADGASADEQRALWVTGSLAGLGLAVSALAFLVCVRLVSEMRSLGGLLPICAHCKKIRDDRGYWNQLEAYLEAHSDAAFTHGICAECQQRLHADLDARRSRASGAGPSDGAADAPAA